MRQHVSGTLGNPWTTREALLYLKTTREQRPQDAHAKALPAVVSERSPPPPPGVALNRHAVCNLRICRNREDFLSTDPLASRAHNPAAFVRSHGPSDTDKGKPVHGRHCERAHTHTHTHGHLCSDTHSPPPQPLFHTLHIHGEPALLSGKWLRLIFDLRSAKPVHTGAATDAFHSVTAVSQPRVAAAAMNVYLEAEALAAAVKGVVSLTA